MYCHGMMNVTIIIILEHTQHNNETPGQYYLRIYIQDTISNWIQTPSLHA